MSITDQVGRATLADLLQLPDDVAAEVIGGHIVQKASPTFEHSDAQGSIITELNRRFRRPSDDDGGVGWWLGTEVEIAYETHEVYRHDLAGWRRDRVPERPRGRPVKTRPDWACEILSPSNWTNDTVVKHRTLYRNGVPHYWIVDVQHGAITEYAWTEAAYAAVVVAQRGERVRLPPFDAVELEIDVLLGGD